MFMREYNSWRALCPPLAAEALTPIWMYLNYIQVPGAHICKWYVPSVLCECQSQMTCGLQKQCQIVLMAVQELDRRIPDDGVPKLDPIEAKSPPIPKTYILPLFSIQQKHVSCSNFACAVSTQVCVIWGWNLITFFHLLVIVVQEVLVCTSCSTSIGPDWTRSNSWRLGLRGIGLKWVNQCERRH